jgi:hypothetical protein
MVFPWVQELSAVVVSSLEQRPAAPSEIRFSIGEKSCGLDLSTGAITDGARASSEILGSEVAFEQIMSGRETLQSAYRAGAITLSGDPEHFLRLAMVLERLASAQVCVQ